MARSQLVKHTIRRLKRRWYLKIRLVQTTRTGADLATGSTSTTSVEVVVRRAILLPTRSKRDYVYDLSYIAANKAFTYGGNFDKSYRFIYVDEKDLRYKDEQDVLQVYTPKIGDSIFTLNGADENTMFEAKDVQKQDDGSAYIIRIEDIKGVLDVI